jgi:hypothetical protein
MKRNTYVKLLVVAGLFFLSQGCKDEVNLPDQDETKYNQIYMPQSVNGVVTAMLPVAAEAQTLIYGANFGGKGYPENDIKVSFSVDAALVEAYNAANNTDYELLPADSYQLSGTETVIKKGILATEPLKVAVKTSGVSAIPMFKKYLLPISINSDFNINPNLKTTYFLISSEPNIADYPNYNRAAWKIIDFSSEEASGEGPNNGKAMFVIDDNIQTFWHSQWQGASPGPPHYITIDMGEELTLHGVNITARQVDGVGSKPEEIQIESSLDNVTWTGAGQFTLTGVRTEQKKWLPVFVKARYIKYVVISSFNSTNAHLAEFGAY